MRPFKNPGCSKTKRERYFNKRMLEEIAYMKDILDIHSPQSQIDALRDYIEKKTLTDHITREILRGVLQWFVDNERFRLPKTLEEQYQFEKKRNQDSQVIGKLIDESESVSVGKMLQRNEQTGDVEYVYYNATNADQLDEQYNGVVTVIKTSKRRIEKRIDNATKPTKQRKRIIQVERVRERRLKKGVA